MSETYLDHYKVLDEIGQGSFGKVKLVQSPQGTIFAAKVMKENSSFRECHLDALRNEYSISKSIDHPNVAKVKEMKISGEYIKPLSTDIVNYLVFDYHSNGSLFDLIKNLKAIPEKNARSYFKQILAAVEAFHSNGLCHRDIKPDNILIDSNFNPVLADFGLSCSLLGPKGDGLFRDKVGNEAMQAPEIRNRQVYKADKADIFALGITAFAMVTGQRPFGVAEKSNSWYSLFLSNKKRFWQEVARSVPGRALTDEFKELIEGMLHDNPRLRWDIDVIKESSWYKGEDHGPIEY